jgi:hypothetical protein
MGIAMLRERRQRVNNRQRVGYLRARRTTASLQLGIQKL